MVGYDCWGIAAREWSETDNGGEPAYHVAEGFWTWETYRKRERCYSGDTGTGRMRDRLVAGAISLMCHWGGDSANSGYVPDLGTYVNGLHLSDC